MAFDCPTLTSALAAFSSAHLALQDGAFRDVALRHRGQVLAGLRDALTEGTLSTEMSLATSLVLCSMESISDPSGTWSDHLSGAAAILRPRGAVAVPTADSDGGLIEEDA